MSSLKPIILAEDLAAGYGRHVVWQQASFGIERGEFVAVLGPNGGGKTTLLKILLGLTRPLSGNVHVLGESPRRGHPRVGYVPQRHPIDSDVMIEARELVCLGRTGHRWGISLDGKGNHEAAEQALRDVEAASLARQPLGSLSGGELQRIFLAEALVSNPELLLLDEPLANLDIRRERELVQLMDAVVRKRGVTVLLIAHNINPLLPYLDRIIYIANGRVATGRPDEVLTSEALSSLYGTSIEVVRDSQGRLVVLGIEEASAHHD